MNSPKEHPPLGQFQLRHLMILMAVAAVLFATLSVQVRNSSRRVQVSATAQSVALVAMVVGCLAYCLRARQKIERKAGLPIERFGRFRQAWLSVIMIGLFVVTYACDAGSRVYSAKPGQIINLLPSPFYVFFIVNYFVVRVWWKIDPLGIEACRNGLILGGLNFRAWDEISRFTWSGKLGRQLNLYLKQKIVLNLTGIDPPNLPSLDRILHEHVGQDAEAVATV